MKLLLDEHYSGLIAERLRGAGHDAYSVADLGLRGIADEPLLERARQERRALLTNNVRHFAPLAIRWAAERRGHFGLLFTDDQPAAKHAAARSSNEAAHSTAIPSSWPTSRISVGMSRTVRLTGATTMPASTPTASDRLTTRTGRRLSWRGVAEAQSRVHRGGRIRALFFLGVMSLNIKDEEADRLARELATETGESITAAVTVAVRERLERLRGAVPRERRRHELTQIAKRSAGRPVRDQRSAEEILGYGRTGLPS